MSNISQIDDLLLNSAALAFVLDIDELLFKTVVPGVVFRKVDNLEAIPLSIAETLGYLPMAHALAPFSPQGPVRKLSLVMSKTSAERLWHMGSSVAGAVQRCCQGLQQWRRNPAPTTCK